ncbi:MAG: AAA family ATPase [Bifidobacteriaceae bacterium]|jgi:hypothetical protein|nr:AAA family ATPase [Bifidobacteriaceae bacterium]
MESKLKDDKLYFLKGKNKTDKIEEFIELGNNEYGVIFKPNKNRNNVETGSKCYIYKSDSIVIENLRQTLDGKEFLVLVDGEVRGGVEKIKEFDNHYQLVYSKGYKKVVSKNRIEIVSSCLNDKNIKKRFDYFKETASIVSLKTDDGDKILENYYNKIDFIRSDSIFRHYLEGKIEKIRNNGRGKKAKTIYPFGYNKSQKKATENALNSKISIIQGPPGTGKTQTILNILANLIIENKSVAIVSNNNSAIDNIREKLEECEVDFISAKLGSLKNKNDFF